MRRVRDVGDDDCRRDRRIREEAGREAEEDRSNCRSSRSGNHSRNRNRAEEDRGEEEDRGDDDAAADPCWDGSWCDLDDS